ncbi:DUF4191 domain-containing protein [Homoserinibacter sp. YIM 151385]|uniref:DUF4191 domain-containing protein n=1 Tax=Homoserinibacter sp. YIM 151385 TaxID=2985506 RepID=UPI0022F0EE1A|nr:DUF4191 domain-containing protein [Homoserinibacter sp. YIM 151385]WBU38481.1 DUF4191 domain-containing protein [Homoserinibacter sp. YIM 151385]
MARTTAPAAKEPGRIKQMWQVFKMTQRYDSLTIWYLLAAFLVPLGVGLALAFLLSAGNVIGIILYVLVGLLGGVLVLLIVLGRRAERAAFSQIEGQPGAVGSVIKTSLRRSWVGSEMPVNVSPRTQDAVYRAVGKGGVVLIGEGPRSRTEPMLKKEKANVARIVPNVTVHVIHVGPDADSVPLYKIVPTLSRFKRSLNRAEIHAVSSRLSSLSRTPGNIGIPKGIDPTKVRAPRPR